MTGVPHFTHQLPRGADSCKPYLLRQHPWLVDITPPVEFRDKDHVDQWLVEQIAKHGEYHDVRRFPAGVYVGRDPISEMVEMVGSDRVIVVTEDGGVDG